VYLLYGTFSILTPPFVVHHKLWCPYFPTYLTQKGWSNPASDEYSTFGYPQEIQDFMEAIAMDREPKSGMRVASDTVAALSTPPMSRLNTKAKR
jgi:hypothetical protein